MRLAFQVNHLPLVLALLPRHTAAQGVALLDLLLPRAVGRRPREMAVYGSVGYNSDKLSVKLSVGWEVRAAMSIS